MTTLQPTNPDSPTELEKILEQVKTEYEESWGVHNSGSSDAIDTEAWAKTVIQALIAQAVKEAYKKGYIDGELNYYPLLEVITKEDKQ